MDGEDVPRSNFDSFWKALITVFQVQHCVGLFLVSSQREALIMLSEQFSCHEVYCAYWQLYVVEEDERVYPLYHDTNRFSPVHLCWVRLKYHIELLKTLFAILLLFFPSSIIEWISRNPSMKWRSNHDHVIWTQNDFYGAQPLKNWTIKQTLAQRDR